MSSNVVTADFRRNRPGEQQNAAQPGAPLTVAAHATAPHTPSTLEHWYTSQRGVFDELGRIFASDPSAAVSAVQVKNDIETLRADLDAVGGKLAQTATSDEVFLHVQVELRGLGQRLVALEPRVLEAVGAAVAFDVPAVVEQNTALGMAPAARPRVLMWVGIGAGVLALGGIGFWAYKMHKAAEEPPALRALPSAKRLKLKRAKPAR